ncbi:MAG TPA: histidine--tRNA ligase [Vicinamibacterales bacterium]
MSTQPARGMRDFLPEDVRRREYVVGIIRGVYDRYGFEPLETPAVENIETLLGGHYGDENSKLIYKILKRGEHEASGQADLALRYDLTVPLARVVAEYQSKLPRFFKRYQIQPVWRADRPARGRFREFYQCDIDSIGSTSPVVEAEQIAAVSEILTTLGFEDFVIRINHRKFIAAWLNQIPVPAERHGDVLITIDKADKIGKEGIAKELAGKNYSATQIAGITEWIGAPHPPEWLDSIESAFSAGDDTGLENLRQIVRLTAQSKVAEKIRIDPSLARGLGYYTGTIMEINVKDLPGSLAGGGRYDNLIGMFLGTDVPACGVSLGLERILVVMQERGMFPPEVEQGSIDVVVAALEESAQGAAMETAAELRRSTSLRVDVYPDVAKKMDRIFKYVDQRKAKFIAILGSDEVAAGTVTVRNVALKTKETMARTQAAAAIQRALSD